MHTNDLHASLLALMGIDHAVDVSLPGRDFRLTDAAGRVVNDSIE